MSWQEAYKNKLTSFDEAVKKIDSGDVVWISGITDTPFQLIDAMCARKDELTDVKVIGGILVKPFDFLKKEFKGHINYQSVFLGPVERMFVPQGNVEVTSMHFSETTAAIKNKFKPTVLMVTCTPPDENGYMRFGPLGSFSCDAAAEVADKIIIQVNKHMPVIEGHQNTIHVDRVDVICEGDYELPCLPNPPVDEDDKKIASFIEPMINDGDTLQIGIGGIGNAVAYSLDGKKDLGIHSEMLVDSLVDLAKKGVVTGNKKNLNPGKITFGFAAGGKELLDFIGDNPQCEIRPFEYTNDPLIIGANDNMISINSAISVDLTGQVCSESIGFKQFSSTGGQIDFVRGARISKGGKSFIALKSTVKTEKGLASKITTKLAPGTVVTTPRSDIEYLVTEYGMVNLKYKSIPERVKAIISIAHPDFRDQLTAEAKEAGLI